MGEGFSLIRIVLSRVSLHKMGVQSSKKKLAETKKAALPDNRYKVVFRVQNEVIRFDPNQSRALCVGMDRLAKSPKRSLGPLVKHDCMGLSETCSSSLCIPESYVKTLVASKDPHELMNEVGLSTLIIDSARSVGPEGVFVFTFSGHGIKAVKNSTEQPVLPLINHTSEEPECLSGSDLVELILYKANFRGKKVILVLDCCFSGGITKWLNYNQNSEGKFRSISACSPYQTSIQLDPLGHSIFTYFLLDALKGREGIVESCKHEHPDQGIRIRLCLKDIFEHICNSSWALSAMYIKYDPVTQSLRGCTMTPEVSSKLKRTQSEENMLDAVETTDGGRYQDPQGRLQIIQKYWKAFPRAMADTSRRMPQNSYRWLRQQMVPNGPLSMLQEKGHFKGKVVQAVLCALANSVAAIHLYERHPWNGKARLFIVDFTEIISIVVPVSLEEVEDHLQFSSIKEVLSYYYAAYRSVEFPDVSELKSLFRMIAADQIHAENQIAQESTDGEVSVKVPDLDK